MVVRRFILFPPIKWFIAGFKKQIRDVRTTLYSIQICRKCSNVGRGRDLKLRLLISKEVVYTGQKKALLHIKSLPWVYR